MPKNLLLGSKEWADHVFISPPARRLKGHSRRTQHHRFYSERLGTIVGVQGRNECSTALAIEYLIVLGMVRRAKPQPFLTQKEQFGQEICPDFLLELADENNSLVVIETKSARFLTRAKQFELDAYRKKFAEFEIRYLVWTDETPLNHSVRHHLANMRAGAQRITAAGKINSLISGINASNMPTVGQFYEEGFDWDTLYAAAWEGKAYFPLTKPLNNSTILHVRPLENYEMLFLHCENRMDEWWNGLLAE